MVTMVTIFMGYMKGSVNLPFPVIFYNLAIPFQGSRPEYYIGVEVKFFHARLFEVG
jgi:hypothetical protein